MNDGRTEKKRKIIKIVKSYFLKVFVPNFYGSIQFYRETMFFLEGTDTLFNTF